MICRFCHSQLPDEKVYRCAHCGAKLRMTNAMVDFLVGLVVVLAMAGVGGYVWWSYHCANERTRAAKDDCDAARAKFNRDMQHIDGRNATGH